MKLKPGGYSESILLRQGRVPGIMNIMICAVMLALLLGGISCSKEKDDKNPVVEIELPSENQTFMIGDSIRVKGWASDETALKSVQVTITDMNFIVRDYMANITVSGNPQYFDFWYMPTSLKLPDGDYFLQVRASDGVNTKYKYRQIRLSGNSQVLKSLVVITRTGTVSFSLNTLDPATLGFKQQADYQHTYSGSGISWYAEQLCLLGKGFGECYVLDPEDYTLKFKLQQDGTPSLDYHEKLLAGTDRFYLGLTDGYVKGYNKLGVQQFIAEITPGRRPREMALHRQLFLVVAEEHRSDPGSWIGTYFLSSGNKWTEYRLPEGFEVVSIASVSNDEVLLAGNLNGIGRLIQWNISASAITTAWEAPSGKINDMLSAGGGAFLLACDADIKVFQLPQQSVATLLSHPGAMRLRIDPGTGTLFTGNTNAITAYHLGSGATLWHKTFTGALADFHLNYE